LITARHIPPARSGGARRHAAAGEIAAELGIPPNTLSFHFDRLRHAGLVKFERQGRSLIYAARYGTMLLSFFHVSTIIEVVYDCQHDL
jgi:DNA-binding transcriptional ArsR family regulator